MEVAEQPEELNMTADEVNRFTDALKDENFRKMLHDYAQEISDPENKKMYEEDIKRLEAERGNTVEFIHPEPFRSFKTSVNGKQKCFVNICRSEKVGKPECKSVMSEDGRRGQHWSLPHSLHPGRQDADGKGNKILIYDVVFHPDTLHIASKSKRFMDMVENTAMQGIQQAFKVTLDQKNVKEMQTKYKGVPQACVVRRPIPGASPREPSEHPDPLTVPYPDETTPASMRPSQTKPPNVKQTEEPTKPKYMVKYRSVVDLQSFTRSRDSAQSSRPKEIVVTVDLPLLKSAGDASLEVKDTVLLLESRRPAYRLELPLAYPVDEDKGEAAFNKQRGQLVVTLPVRPRNAALKLSAAVADGLQSETESHGMGHEDNWTQERENEEKKVEEIQMNDEGRKVKEARGREKREEKVRKGEEREEAEGQQSPESGGKDGEEEVKEQKQVSRDEVGRVALQNEDELGPEEAGEEDSKVINDGASLDPTSRHEESLDTAVASLPPSGTDRCVSKSDGASETDGPDRGLGPGSGESVADAAQRQEAEDGEEDDQSVQTSPWDNEPPAAALREVDEDGNETVISDHSTSAGFTFQNTLMFELD